MNADTSLQYNFISNALHGTPLKLYNNGIA